MEEEFAKILFNQLMSIQEEKSKEKKAKMEKKLSNYFEKVIKEKKKESDETVERLFYTKNTNQ